MRLFIEPASTDAAAAAVEGSRKLEIVLERQEASQWCWAAIAVAAARAFGTGQITQAEVAARLQAEDATPTRNQPRRLLDAVRIAGCDGHWTPGRPTPARLRREIDAGRPFCMRLTWAGGQSHFVMIVGYAAGGRELIIEDPSGDPGLQSLEDFPGLYRGRTAVWRETYWLRAADPVSPG